LHGISADGRMNWEWTGIAPALRDAGFRTVAIDQRGHGKSDKPHDPSTTTTTCSPATWRLCSTISASSSAC
jgi:pimeloyl-ACP methyl ester carboxylesterase